MDRIPINDINHDSVEYFNIPVFLLSAGLGTRLRPLTDGCPKPLIEFAHIPLIVHSWYFLGRTAQFPLVICNGHYLAEKLFQWLQQYKNVFHPAELVLSDESQQLLGSGGALLKQRSLLESYPYFVVMNSDTILFSLQNPFEFYRLFQHHRNSGALATLLVTHVPQKQDAYNAVWADSMG
ncbi:MAG: sugar phosphate nucleotidyltransferase, partial [Bdellovibrionaceae bacterium]|nr:sugar phosphate nucleotidyltransferase [Pseudobdellovibrionaceae bacterium]